MKEEEVKITYILLPQQKIVVTHAGFAEQMNILQNIKNNDSTLVYVEDNDVFKHPVFGRFVNIDEDTTPILKIAAYTVSVDGTYCSVICKIF